MSAFPCCERVQSCNKVMWSMCRSIFDSDKEERFGFEEETGRRCEYICVWDFSRSLFYRLPVYIL